MEETLVKFQHFFETDTRIKKEMYNMAPPNYIDGDSLVEYTDKLDESLNYIFSELKCIALDLFGKESYELQRITTVEKEAKKAFYACGIDINKLRNFYRNYISNMDENFLNQVKGNYIGYAFSWHNPMSSATTTNEMLHCMHSAIVNNEQLLQSIPLLEEKTNNNNEPISLRGVPTERFKEFFDQIPNDLDIGITEIVCVSNKRMLMMIRDRGHALTIDVSLSGEKARVEYFIPKNCNIAMINTLPGINKINENSVGATGVFETSIDTLSESLISFISKVPTDMDIDFEEYRFK